MATNATTASGNASATPNAWDQKELGVLWKRVKKGTTEKYLTGTINLKALGFDKDVSVVVFSNKRKSKDTHPDLRIYLSEKKDATAPVKRTAPAAAPAADAAADAELI